MGLKRAVGIAITALALSSGALAAPTSRQTGPVASPQRYELTTRQVAVALAREFAESGVQISDEQVSLMSNVMSTEPDPLLDIKSVERISYEASPSKIQSQTPVPSLSRSLVRSRVKLACHLPGACLPFYAIVSWPGGKDGQTKTGYTTAHTGTAHRAITMPVGARATLVIAGRASEIQLTVISLESGRAGDMIRVQSPDRKQTYTAEVVSRNQLKGSF